MALNINEFPLICRLCLSQGKKLFSLFIEMNESAKLEDMEDVSTNVNSIAVCDNNNEINIMRKGINVTSIQQLIESILGLKISLDDLLPNSICTDCRNLLLSIKIFRLKCLRSNEMLKASLVKSEDLNKCESLKLEHNENNKFLLIDKVVPESNEIEKLSSNAVAKEVNEADFKVSDSNIEMQMKKKSCKGTEIKLKDKQKRIRKVPSGICHICGVYRVHLPNHIASHKSKITTYTCDICQKLFYALGNIRRHIMSVHVNERKFKCGICPQTSNTLTLIRKHMITHTGERPFKCDDCDKSFTQRYILKYHKRIHTNVKKYHCDYCDKSFTFSSTYQSHIGIHTGERPFKCGICPLTFVNSSSASLHRRKHRSNTDKYICELCNIGFNLKPDYRCHMKQHLNDNNLIIESYIKKI